jgi:pyruvate/2-oxoglutarate dehydrogenase complex dihydrolipoamide dehydrogenase (E3) component
MGNGETTTRVVVIGGGPAGVSAALRARELGAEVILLEAGRLGGTCTNTGCAPMRSLARSARLLRDAAGSEPFGIVHGADGPRADLARVMERVRATVEELHGKKDLLGHLTDCGVTVREGVGPVRFAGPEAVTFGEGGDMETLTADRFLLCAGGTPRRPDFPGAEYAHYPTDLVTWRDLPRSVVIVGGAATGCQLASCLATFGIAVTLLETAPRLLPGEDEAVSEAIARAFAERGVAVHVGICPVERIEKREGDGATRYRCHYGEGDEPRHAEGGAVVVSIGWPGNVRGLNLEAAGIAVEKGYVRADDRLRTTNARVWAAGDVTGRSPLVSSATVEGRYAAESALGRAGDGLTHEIVPRGGFTDPEYGGVGLTEAGAKKQGRPVLVATADAADLDRARIDRRPEGFCKLIVCPETRRVLGAHVVGEQALEVVQAVAVGMTAGVTLDHLAAAQFAYPTMTAILGIAARNLCRDLGSVERHCDPGPLRADGAVEWERAERAV